MFITKQAKGLARTRPGWAMLALFVALLASVLMPHARAARNIPAELLARAHSHNDYFQQRPLLDALDQHFYSVEADVWLHEGEVQVSHLGIFFNGTLEKMYLQPLQKIVDAKGSVYGDGRPFYLWVELKEGSPELRRELNDLLNRYPMLTVFTNHGIHRGPVTIILTGDEESKRRFVEDYPERRACRDAGQFADTDPPADPKWRWYAIPWDGWMRNYAALKAFADKIHAKGRKLRLYAVPQFEWIWQGVLSANVDQISVDDLPWMHRFLAAHAKTHVNAQ